MTSKVILTNVQVLAAGTKIERGTGNDKPIAVTVVTLLVDPEQAERLTLASTEGKIQLALRNPLDKTTPVTRGVKPASLLGAAGDDPEGDRAPGCRGQRWRPAAADTVHRRSYSWRQTRTRSRASGVADYGCARRLIRGVAD